jgi:hypothetical protein
MEPLGSERHGRAARRASEWEFARHYPPAVARATYGVAGADE